MEVEMDTAEKEGSFLIKASNVPQEFFEKRDVAKRYFRRFGKLKGVMFKPKRNSILIEYTNEDSMLNALEVAGEFKGEFFDVTRDTETVIKKKNTKKDADPDWTDDPEVRAELEAMGAFRQTKAYDLRSDAMNVDAEVPKIKSRMRWKTVTASPKSQKKKPAAAKETFRERPAHAQQPVLHRPTFFSSSEQAELSQIIKQQAHTTEDKFKILDARDKLIRIRLKRNLEVSKARATVGTCPDMCPEKERLMREIQHQVALYEQGEGPKEMNPRLAVKQYSRSSADQEAPLPQELRPVHVLQMTMGYLMHRIMGLCETADVNIAEWYHFLWDRMRGIRKDITQQELCSQGAAELVEQCARFHIFCSARLVSEDPAVFDQKINTENLTKCLQTLKYMYHDLQLKGESCRNESEFRAYIILLNLNDGNFMWEVQQLKRDIQESKEVKFALKVYASLDKHNYVKFFKLVNSTTFLNACILMRYFIQVRISAIKTFLKSYSPRVSQASLPVQHLTKILGFEGTESCIDFFESYGLYTNIERTRIVLDRLGFSPPQYPYILDRAINLVESKNRQSVGEVICGRSLPPKTYENHVPQNSFNNNGHLILPPDLDVVDAAIRKDESMKIPEKKEEPPQIYTPPITVQVAKESPRPFADPITVEKETASIFAPPVAQTQSIFAPPTSAPTSSIFGQGPSDRSLWTQPPAIDRSASLWAQPTTTSTNIFGNVAPTQTNIFGGEIKQIDIPKFQTVEQEDEESDDEDDDDDESEKERLEEELRRQKDEAERQRRQKEEEEERLQEMRRKLLEEQERKRRLEEAQRIAAMTQRLMEEQRRREQERRKNIEIKAAVSNVISDLLDGVEENMKREKLAEISRKIHDRKVKRVVKKWRENTRRRRKRKALDFNPSWYAAKSVKEEAKELKMSCQNLAMQSMKRYKTGKPFEFQIEEEEDVSRIDLCELTYKLLRKKFLELDTKISSELFWKVTVSLPNELEYGSGLNHVEKILDNYIKWEKRGSTTVLIEQSKSLPTITYCLEKQKGLIINSKNATSGFIFIANEFSDDLCKRIIKNFENFGIAVKLPVVLVLQTYSEKNSKIKALIREGVISDYLILVDKFTSKNLINLTEEALIFLSTRTERSPPLEMDTLKSFLVKHLCSELWKRANSFARWNSNYKNCLKHPNTVIYLYNEALGRLRSILLDESCREHAKFPEIFKDCLRSQIPDSLPCDYRYFPNFWDNESYLKHVGAVLGALPLPNFLENWPSGTPVDLEVAVSKYCSQVLKEPQKCFYKAMSIILNNVDPEENFADVANVVWTDVVELIALEKLEQVDFSLYGTGFVNKSVYNQLVVVYDVNTLNDFVKSDWFYVSHPIIKQKVSQFLEDDRVHGSAAQVCDVAEDLDLDKILAQLQEPRSLNFGKIKSELSACQKLMSDLEDSVTVHKKICEKSGQLLKTMIEDS